jgi:flagellar motility protein MotE (MotC chaperone)
MKAFRNIRVIPVALIAVACLAVLKVAGLVIDGGYVFDYDPKSTKRSWAQENLGYPGREDSDVTGSTHGAPKEKKEEPPKPAAPDTKPDGIVIRPEESQQLVSPSEKAILERLQSRRQELDARAREIDIRESLLRAAEQRIQSKTDEMKAIEQRISAASGQKAEQDNARFKSIVTMYEVMKPKDAAKVFDRLEMSVLIEIASQIAPRKMSDILGLMLPEAAERLTVELARRAGAERTEASVELPKIEGKMLPQKSN